MPSQAEHTPGSRPSARGRRSSASGRMRTLLAALGDPQLAYPAIHVVGTNGKSTATRTIEALLLAEGLSVGATVSPHVRSWAERITVDGEEADFEAAIGRVRPEAEAQEATQFETLCAAAFAEFARARRRRRRRRGGARRPARRDQRPPLARRPAHQRRARAHRRARRDPRADRGGEARRRPGGDGRGAAGRGVRPPRRPERRRRRRPRGGRRLPGPRSRARGRGRRCPAGSSGAATRSGTAPTTPTACAGWWRSSTATTTRSWRRSCATRTRSRCSRRSPRGDAASSPPSRRTPARSRPRELAHLASHHFPEVEIEPDPAAALARGARAPARPRHRLAVPSCGFGEERGVI